VRREGTEYYGRREDEASKTTWEKRRPSRPQCRLPWPSSSSSSSSSLVSLPAVVWWKWRWCAGGEARVRGWRRRR
jgi:hypothetical protein